jgi:hypothetical protein
LGFSPEEITFHELLHCHRHFTDPVTGEQFSLFHGQPFGLHPGSGLLFKTKTGTELVGDYLSNPTDPDCRDRLLHAIAICLFQYSSYHSEQLLRKPESRAGRRQNYDQATQAEMMKNTGQLRPRSKHL